MPGPWYGATLNIIYTCSLFFLIIWLVLFLPWKSFIDLHNMRGLAKMSQNVLSHIAHRSETYFHFNILSFMISCEVDLVITTWIMTPHLLCYTNDSPNNTDIYARGNSLWQFFPRLNPYIMSSRTGRTTKFTITDAFVLVSTIFRHTFRTGDAMDGDSRQAYQLTCGSWLNGSSSIMHTGQNIL